MTPEELVATVPPRVIWQASRLLDTNEIAKAILRDAFMAWPKLDQVAFDFVDCEGVPFIWLNVMDEDGEEDDLNFFDFSEDTPEGFPSDEIEAIAYKFLAAHEGNRSFTRLEILGEPPVGPSSTG